MFVVQAMARSRRAVAGGPGGTGTAQPSAVRLAQYGSGGVPLDQHHGPAELGWVVAARCAAAVSDAQLLNHLYGCSAALQPPVATLRWYGIVGLGVWPLSSFTGPTPRCRGNVHSSAHKMMTHSQAHPLEQMSPCRAADAPILWTLVLQPQSLTASTSTLIMVCT